MLEHGALSAPDVALDRHQERSATAAATLRSLGRHHGFGSGSITTVVCLFPFRRESKLGTKQKLEMGRPDSSSCSIDRRNVSGMDVHKIDRHGRSISIHIRSQKYPDTVIICLYRLSIYFLIQIKNKENLRPFFSKMIQLGKLTTQDPELI